MPSVVCIVFKVTPMPFALGSFKKRKVLGGVPINAMVRQLRKGSTLVMTVGVIIHFGRMFREKNINRISCTLFVKLFGDGFSSHELVSFGLAVSRSLDE